MKKFVKKFVERAEDHKSSTAYYGWIFEEQLLIGQNTACHAGLNNQNLKKRKDKLLGVITSNINNNNIDKTQQENFTKWFANDSVWSPFILNKDESAFNYLLFKPDTPKLILSSGCIASRYLREYPTRLPVWNTLYEAGIDGGLCFYLANIINSKNNSYPFYYQPLGSGAHNALKGAYQTKNQVKNIVARKFVKSAYKYPYNKYFDYKGSTVDVFGEGDDRGFSEKIQAFERVIETVNYNIFYKKDMKNAVLCEDKEDVKQLGKFATKLLEKNDD